MEFIPYKINECFENLYYQIPMELFFNENYKDKLNLDSKILYGFLLNRLALSQKNNWHDENGHTYLIFTRKKVQQMLNLSDKTVTKAFKQLAEVKLIYEKRQGKNKPNLIYVGQINHMPQSKFVNRKIYGSGIVNSTNQDAENLRPRKNNINYNDRENRKSFSTFEGNYSNADWDLLYDN